MKRKSPAHEMQCKLREARKRIRELEAQIQRMQREADGWRQHFGRGNSYEDIVRRERYADYWRQRRAAEMKRTDLDAYERSRKRLTRVRQQFERLIEAEPQKPRRRRSR